MTTSTTRPDDAVAAPDVGAIESVVRRAIDENRPDLVRIVGKGEFSIAIVWETDGVPCVMKRVPPFVSRSAADQYVALVRENLSILRDFGVRCVTTDLYSLDRSDASTVVYHCQPLLPEESLADRLLYRTPPSVDHGIVTSVVDAVVRVVGGGTPLDAQFANWFWFEEEVWQLDFSTPMMVDRNCGLRFDARGFLREYPAMVRPLVVRELNKIAPRFGEIDYVLTDVLVQLYRQGIENWVEPYIATVRQRHGVELSAVLAKERFGEEVKLYPTLLRLKKLQRAWLRRTGRRYDSLLPATTGFGK